MGSAYENRPNCPEDLVFVVVLILVSLVVLQGHLVAPVDLSLQMLGLASTVVADLWAFWNPVVDSLRDA